MEKGGIEVFDQGKDYGGQVNYVHAYEFFCKKTTLAMVEAWESEMGVGSALCGSVRAKANRHEWDNGALRLLISGEGLSASAYKYARGLQQPPTAVRARQPRQANGRVANDGPAWNVPAGLVLVGGDALDRVGTETYVWRTGDPHRSSRELHETILALVFLGGLVWCPESVGLNQKAGGTFNDEQRARGGRYGVDEEVWNGERKPIAEEQRLMDKKKKDTSAAANSCSVDGCSCTESGVACSCDGHMHVKNASVGALNSGPGYGGVGKPFNSGNGATARDFSAEGANDEWYGLHLDIPTRDLAAKLRLLVQPDGSLKDAPLCDTKVNPDHPGLTKDRSTFGLDREGALIMGVHNSNRPNRCVGGGTIPATTAAPPYRVPHFAIAPLLAGKIVSNKTHNQRERTRAKLNEE